MRDVSGRHSGALSPHPQQSRSSPHLSHIASSSSAGGAAGTDNRTRKGARMSQRSTRSLALHLGLGVVVASLTGVGVYTSGVNTVRIEDRCDPASFDAAVGPGTCIQDGGTTFDEFIAELQATGVAEHWRFKEDEFHIRAGEAVNAFNIGGEVHS